MSRKAYLQCRATGKTCYMICHWESVRSVSYIFGRIYEINNLGRIHFVYQTLMLYSI